MSKIQPPSWALNFIRFFFKERYLEQIEGDLFELFEREPSIKRARRQFGWNTLRFFRFRYLKELDDYQQLTILAMVKNYLKVAIRTLLKQKSYATINITGLAIGLASCLLIVMYIAHERNYDQFYPDLNRMYRVANGPRGAFTPPMLAKTMMEEYSQVESATRIGGLYESNFKIGDRIFLQQGGAWADENIFKVFETEFISGDPETALSKPDNIVLTETLAKKCFPDKPAMNEFIQVDGDSYQVTGIVKDPLRTTHFPYQFIGASLEPGHNNWTGNSNWTYAKIRPGVSVEEMNEKLQELYIKYVGPEMITFSGHESFEELMAENPDRYYGFTVFPVERIHLHQPRFSMGPRGDYSNVVNFSIIALFILLTACVNYINMSTARSAVRSKEVGIRKALGSYRKHIMSQFLVESVVITTIAIILAVGISGASLSYFNQLTGREFQLSDLFTITNILSIGGLIIVVGLLAGVYPAYVMSGFSPLKALRGQMQQGGKKGLRSGLVAFQFAISIFLVAVTFVIYSQVKYMQSQELGVNIEENLVIRNGTELGEKYEVFKTQLEQLQSVTKVAKMNQTPFGFTPDWTYVIPEMDNKRISPTNIFVSPETLEVLDLELENGRFFDTRVSDTASIIINQTLAKELGWEEPIGKVMSRGRGLDFKVIGVLKDFNYTSLKREIYPLVYRLGYKESEVGEWHQSNIVARMNTQDVLNSIDRIESIWDQLVPEYPFDAHFLSDSFQKHYESERKFGSVFTAFSLLAILIAFLGLFALTTFVLQRRFKEIAVRKVLGATVPSLLRMVLKDFTTLVVIGGIIGIAAAFYWLNDWLQGYSYRIDLTWYFLVLPIVLILTLTWIVVSLKSYGVAVSNPANALKEE